jgi:hypothetical protein
MERYIFIIFVCQQSGNRKLNMASADSPKTSVVAVYQTTGHNLYARPDKTSNLTGCEL